MFNSGLFGNNSNNNNKNTINNSTNPFGINNHSTITFGINNNQQGQGLFGNNITNINTANQSAILFGVNNNNNQQNQNNQGNIFNNINNNNNLGLLNNNNNNPGGLFQNNNNILNPNNIGLNNNNINDNENIRFIATVSPVIALSQNNDLKNEQFSKFPKEFHEVVMNLKLNLKDQEMKLEELKRYSKRLKELNTQNNKTVEKMTKLNNSIIQRLNVYEEKINKMKENYNFIFESFEEDEKNLKLMEKGQDNKLKIEIPSKYLVNYSQNLLNRTSLFKKKLDDIITLIKISYAQKNNNYEFDCDIMESTLAEFIRIIKYLLEANTRQERMVNEMIQILLKLASDLGENPETVYNNVIQYSIECNSNLLNNIV